MAQAPLSWPKRLATGAASAAGLDRAARFANRRRLLVVCYHGLREDDAPERHWLLAPRGEFARQIAYLARHYRCVPIDQGLAELRADRLREPTACVTFDDGYRSNYTLGLPVLREHGVPATVYLPTGLIDTGALVWTTQVELAFRAATAAQVDLTPLGLGVRPLGDPAERVRLGRQVVEALKLRPDEARAHWVRELPRLLDAGEVRGADAFALLSWDEVRAMASSGLVTFGAHTVSHGILSQLCDDAVVREVCDSVRAVAAQTSAVSRTFAYPNGRTVDFDARAEAAARAAGVVAALASIEGLNAPTANPYALRRVLVGGGTTLDDFRLRAAGLVAMVRDTHSLSRRPGAATPPAALPVGP